MQPLDPETFFWRVGVSKLILLFLERCETGQAFVRVSGLSFAILKFAAAAQHQITVF